MKNLFDKLNCHVCVCGAIWSNKLESHYGKLLLNWLQHWLKMKIILGYTLPMNGMEWELCWEVCSVTFCVKCVKLISCFVAPVSIGLFLLAPVLMAQTPASMCTPLKTLNDSLSHRRRYMVSEWWLVCKHVSGNVYTSNKCKCKYTYWKCTQKETAPYLGQTPKTLVPTLLIMQLPLCLLCLMNVHIFKTLHQTC